MSLSITTKTLAEIERLHEKGMVDREVANEIGVSLHTVYYWRSKIGLVPNREKERYTVYDRKTSDFLVEGSARQCSAYLGIKLASFRHAVCCFRRGQGGKYEIYKADAKPEE